MHNVMMLAHKQRVRIILDVECYDDLDLDAYEWAEILQLEGDENVHHSITHLDEFE
jgi:hypothetical protein